VKNENIREPENQNSEQNQNNKFGEMSESKQNLKQRIVEFHKKLFRVSEIK